MKTKEEIEKEAYWRFTSGHGAIDEHSAQVFIEACNWIQESEKEPEFCTCVEAPREEIGWNQKRHCNRCDKVLNPI